jgi:hypothetical protein
MGDGRTFDQAVRQLDKLIVEHAQTTPNVPDPDSPELRGYERIISGAGAPYGAGDAAA